MTRMGFVGCKKVAESSEVRCSWEEARTMVVSCMMEFGFGFESKTVGFVVAGEGYRRYELCR